MHILAADNGKTVVSIMHIMLPIAILAVALILGYMLGNTKYIDQEDTSETTQLKVN